MGLRVHSVEFDELTSDPGSPVEGQLWYNTTDSRFKVYRNGSIEVLIDKDELDNHVNSTTNPHTVTLEQARTAGNALSGTIDMGTNKITNMGQPTASGDAAEFQWVLDQIKSKIQGLDWQESVLDKDLTAPPGSPATGDRYIIAAGATGAWATHDGEITEWNGTAWEFIDPNEGYATRVEDENRIYIHDGAAWGPFEAGLDHGALTGKLDDDHTQYLLVNGTRAMGAALDMGAFAITNVGNVDGVDVSDHASRHIDGGSDVVDGDKLEVTWTGHTNYTPSTSPTEVDASDQLTAHLAGIDAALGGMGGALGHKAGRVLNASFAGNPKKATVTFSSAFADANYAVTATGVTTNDKQFALSIESQVAGSFVINAGANSIANLTQVNWIAMKDGESA